jgi:AraC-like DNA-binding protein
VDLFRGLFADIHRALVHEPKNNAQGVVYLEQILIYAAEEAAGGRPPSPYAAQLDALCADIQLAPERDICFRDVACELGLSYSHFRRCFRDHTGETPHRYALQAKLRAAADRIRHTDDPLKQIAADLNLGNPAQFSKTFRHHFDWSPGAWRRRAQV